MIHSLNEPVASCLAYCLPYQKRYIQSDSRNIPRLTEYFTSCLLHLFDVFLDIIDLNNHRGILRRFIISLLKKSSIYCAWLFWPLFIGICCGRRHNFPYLHLAVGFSNQRLWYKSQPSAFCLLLAFQNGLLG